MMDEAIKRLEALKQEYLESLQTTFESQRYYDDLRAKVAAVEEAILRLQH